MRPLFTIHAGEFLVGEFIEKNFPSLNVWIPAKDTGVDLLVTGKADRRPVSLQVKLSRDYKSAEAVSEFDRNLVAAGWLTINHEKLAVSTADLWVIVLVSHERKRKPRFIVIPPEELLRRLVVIHGKSKLYHFYPWVTNDDVCLDGRGLMRAHKRQLVDGSIVLGDRDLSLYLEDWSSLRKLAK